MILLLLILLIINMKLSSSINLELVFNLQEFFQSDLILIAIDKENDEIIKKFFKLQNIQIRAFVGVIDVTKDLETFFDKKYFYSYHNPIILTDGKNNVIKKLMNIKNFTTNLKASFIWVNFIKENITNILKEIFIPFNSRFLIIKEINNINYEIQDVYQLSENSPLIFSNFAVWKKEKLEVFEKNFFVKRMDMKGHPLNISIPPFEATREKDGYLWKLFSERMNFSINWVHTGAGVFYYNGTKTGIFKLIYERKVDGSPALIGFNSYRLSAFDYIAPTEIVETKLYVKQSIGLNWDSYLEPFNFNVWLSVLSWILLASIIIHIIFKANQAITLNYYEYSIFYIFKALCCQGSTLKPLTPSLFIAYLIPYVLSVILLQYYSGALLSYLSIKQSNIHFKNLEQIVEDGSYKILVKDHTFEQFYFNTDPRPLPTAVRNKKLLVHQFPEETLEGFQLTCENRYVFLLETEGLVYKIDCDILEIKKPAFVDNVGIIVWKGFPYKDVLVKVMKQIQFAGLVEFKSKNVLSYKEDVIPFEPFGMDLVLPVFLLYLILITLSVKIYFFEVFWKRKRRRKIQNRVRHLHLFKINATTLT